MNGKTKKTLWWQKLVLLTSSLLLVFVICELIVRSLKLAPQVMPQVGAIRFVDNLKMVYEAVPGAYLIKTNNVISSHVVNNQGFNDTDFTLEKSKHLVRIAMLGDSITQGVFVSPGKTFTDKLEELLNQRAKECHSSLKYEVMNFGVAGYNLAAEVEVLKEKALAYKPDIVILNLYHNDTEPIPGIDILFIGNYFGLTRQEQLQVAKKYIVNRNSLMRQFERTVLYKSQFYLLFVNNLKMLMREKLKGTYAKDMTPIFQGFQEIKKLKEKHKFKFLICIHPFLLFGEHQNNFKFASLADSFQFDYFRMTPYYQKEVSLPQLLQLHDFPQDICHPNEYGHSLIANAMFHELTNRRFIHFR